MPFDIRRGTNISHWLSQSKRRDAERREWFTQADVQRLAGWGFDHIRLPIDEEQMWDEAGRKEPEAWALLDSALNWCHDAGLRVIVDLHILRSHYFMDTSPPLFTDTAEAEKFADLWRQLSAHLRSWSVDQVAYELMNEPVAQDAQDWNRVAMVALGAIREAEKDRLVVLGSNKWSQCITFDELYVPDDRRLILTFHFYNPMLITHYRARWTDAGRYEGPIQYPNVQVTPDVAAALPEDVRKIVEKYNRPYGRTHMIQDLQKPLAVRDRTRLPLYCGEFGVLHTVPMDIRLAWYSDLISVFDELGIAWGNWDYKGGFGIVDQDGRETGIRAGLMGA